MAEQTQVPSRLSRSREDYNAEKETLERTPALVPPADEFFERPSRSFDLDSIPHDKDEFGIAIRTTTTEKQEKDDWRGGAAGRSDQVQAAAPAVTSVSVNADKSTQDDNPDFTAGSETTPCAGESPPSDIPSAQLDGEKETPVSIPTTKPLESQEAGVTSVKQAPIPKSNTQPDQELSDKPTSLGLASIGHTSVVDSKDNEKGKTAMGEEEESIPIRSLSTFTKQAEPNPSSNTQPDQGLKDKPTGSFFDKEADHGLVLAGPKSVTDNKDNEKQIETAEEEELIPIRSLSEVPVISPLYFGTNVRSVIVESSLPENVNAERWELADEDQADLELGGSFGTSRSQNLHAPYTAVAEKDQSLGESPLAPFVRSDNQQPSTPAKESASDHKDIERSKDTAASDADDSNTTIRALGGLAAVAGGGLLLRSFLANKDTDDEKSSSSDMETPVRPHRPGYSFDSDIGVRSGSDDGLTFDEGAGVGMGYKPLSETPLRYGVAADDSSSSGESTPRFTAAEKGKQVVRDAPVMPITQAMPVAQEDAQEDLPPVASVTDKGFGMIGRAHLLPMLRPTPVSPVPLGDEPRSRIYPVAPPGPWTPGSTQDSITQRRTVKLAGRTELASTVVDNDPNLVFMSSSRKQSAITPPAPKEGAKSLLADYPELAPEPSRTAAQPVVTLPKDPSKAPVLTGHYELPSIKEMDQWKGKHSLPPNAFRRLLVNVGALFLFRVVMKMGYYRSVVDFYDTSRLIFYWIECGVIIVLLFNVSEVMFRYLKCSNNFEYLPLTPSQRALLGLDPVASKVPGAVPIFKKSARVPHNLTESPILSTYVSTTQSVFASNKAPFQKTVTGLAPSENRDAATILNKSLSRTFNQQAVQDKADLVRLMRNVEAREELQAERKGVDSDAGKRPFGLHTGFGAPQGGIQGGVDMTAPGAHLNDNMTRPDLIASLNARGPVSRYQPALRTTLSKDHTSKTDLQKDGLYVVGHSKVLKTLKVSEEQLDRWVFNMRKWMWDTIVRNVCNEMEVVDTQFAKWGLSYLDCKSATMFYTSGPPPQSTSSGSAASTNASSTAAPAPAAASMANSLGWGAASIANPQLPSAFNLGAAQPQQPQMPISLQDLEARYGQQDSIVRQRMVLEPYLAIPGFANRKYVVERLQAMGPLLTHFIWDSNGLTWDGGKKAWTPELPTDSQIIMHLFTVYMDLAMPAQPSLAYDRFPFSYKYYVPMESKPDATTALQIKQTSKVPPNYNLVVEGSMWEVVPKRLNVWYTLVLFIYMVMKENGGYIGQLNIDTKLVGLGDVVEGYEM
ncbi:hypothetical protein BG011_006747 [Mortierella polycephala]|uniref:Transmembrane protein n=1 Tax=Mortierella polycephala TaxID=41804 RepID=A0A9P6PRX4_9FUNG|nr:hypothetical protein BG011_006747 [Mortierella polycephala]